MLHEIIKSVNQRLILGDTYKNKRLSFTLLAVGTLSLLKSVSQKSVINDLMLSNANIQLRYKRVKECSTGKKMKIYNIDRRLNTICTWDKNASVLKFSITPCVKYWKKTDIGTLKSTRSIYFIKCDLNCSLVYIHAPVNKSSYSINTHSNVFLRGKTHKNIYFVKSKNKYLIQLIATFLNQNQ